MSAARDDARVIADALRRALDALRTGVDVIGCARETSGGGALETTTSRASSARAREVVDGVMAMLDAHHALSAHAERACGGALEAYARHCAEGAEANARDVGERGVAYARVLGHLSASCGTRAFVRALGAWSGILAEGVRADGDGASGARAASARRDALRTTLTRAAGLVDVPGVRKDASSAIAVAMPGVLKALARGVVDAFALVTTCARLHPSALRAHAATLETQCVTTLAESTNARVRESAVVLLASLPRISGDPATWSEHARRLMCAAQNALNRAFEGAEDGDLKRQLDAMLTPQNESLPVLLGALGGDDVEDAITSMRCLEEMLQTRFSTPVPLPNAAVTTLAARVLNVDGTAVASVPGLPPSPVSPELIIALPRLHTAALALLEAILRTASTTAIPQAGRVARALEGILRRGAPTASHFEQGEPFRMCMHVRACAHDAIATAAYALGGASASGELAAAVAAYVIQDAKPCGTGKSAMANVGNKAHASGKKRKKGGAWGAATAEGLNDLTTAAILDDMSGPTAGSAATEAAKLQTSALRALTALCNVGGAMLSPNVRTKLDSAVAQATAQVNELTFTDDVEDVMANRRDAVYDALLASVLAPRPFRSPNLPLAVATFSKGAEDPATAKKCTQLAMALNALLHPSAPPLAPQAIAPPREDADARSNGAAPQWSTFAAYHEASKDNVASNALRASVNDYYKANEPIKAADITSVDVAPSVDAPVNAATADDRDMDVDAAVEFTPAAPVAVPKTHETARATFQSSAAASSGFAVAAKSAPTSFAQSSAATAPPNDFISFSAAPPKSARTRADMWETNPEPVGLGSGKSKVAVELSDDSDGELPEIHTGDDEDDSDEEEEEEDDDDDGDDDNDDDGDEDENDE